MKKLPLSYKIQLLSGLYILFCIPMIFLAEKYRFTQAPFHISQAIAICISFVAGIIVFIKARKTLIMQDLIISGLGVTLAGLYILFFVFLLFGPVADELWHRQKFDSQAWKQPNKEEDIFWPARICMVDDLIHSKKLDGLTQPEVIELLGEPAEKGFSAGAYECDIHYHLGPERGFIRMDSEWLFIKFGQDGKVSRYWLYTD